MGSLALFASCEKEYPYDTQIPYNNKAQISVTITPSNSGFFSDWLSGEKVGITNSFTKTSSFAHQSTTNFTGDLSNTASPEYIFGAFPYSESSLFSFIDTNNDGIKDGLSYLFNIDNEQEMKLVDENIDMKQLRSYMCMHGVSSEKTTSEGAIEMNMENITTVLKLNLSGLPIKTKVDVVRISSSAGISPKSVTIVNKVSEGTSQRTDSDSEEDEFKITVKDGIIVSEDGETSIYLTLFSNTLAEAVTLDIEVEVEVEVEVFGEMVFGKASNAGIITLDAKNYGAGEANDVDVELGVVKVLKKTLKLTEGQSLNDVLVPEDFNSLEELVVTGNVTGDDFETLRDMKALRIMDLRDAIYTGGEMKEYLYSDDSKGTTNNFGGVAKLHEVIETVYLPKSLTVLAKYTFERCLKLKFVQLPDGLTHIRSSAFEGCKGLVTLDLPEGLEAMESWSMENTSIEHIIIPASVEILGNGTFASIGRTESIMFMKATAPNNIDQGSNFLKGSTHVKLLVPTSGYDSYYDALTWRWRKQIVKY